MCGLTLTIRPVSTSSNTEPEVLESLRASNSARGPDCQRSYSEIVTLSNDQRIEVVLTACVLGLRGTLTTQPLVGQRGVLGWNGQVFQGLQVGTDENDTIKIFERLEKGDQPWDVLRGIEGPYAFIYLHREAQTIYFQLDPLSRRSLLIHPSNINVDELSSSSPSTSAASSNRTEHFILSSTRSSLAREESIEMRALLGGEGGTIRLSDIVFVEDEQIALQMDMSEALNMHSRLPTMTVTDENHGEGASTWTQVTPINSTLPSMQEETDDPEEINRFIDNLRGSIRRRVENIPAPNPGEARVAILFSGGIDCTFLAYLAHQCIPPSEPIDLINVAFAPAPAAPDSTNGSNSEDKGKRKEKVEKYDVPDRSSGIEALQELRNTCHGREWRFVNVNVTYEESRNHRQKVVDLMYPSITEMDLSLAYPLYFASRGIGTLEEQEESIEYRVKAKVYLSGLGADEQLGGYARHRQAYFDRGWQGLIKETQMDIARLPTRNLSRDDRLISSQARDARYPYLDLSFISYLSSLPIKIKCDPSLGIGLGDKKLLRLAAKQCGLIKTGERVKRAMQFGTRSAKVGGKGTGVRGHKAGQREVL